MTVDPQLMKSAADRLRPVLAGMISHPDPDVALILSSRDEVLARYQPIFSPGNVASITEEQFKSFLLAKNNRHWGGLHRFGGAITADMGKLGKALAVLLDESRPVRERLNQLLPNNLALVPRLGPATLTPILLVAFPAKYGVINNPAKAALKEIGLWPELGRKTPFGDRYEKVNEIFLALTAELNTDLWTLDAIWWRILGRQTADTEEIAQLGETVGAEIVEAQAFGLEKYLQEFIRDNWEKIKEFKDWSLYEEDGELAGFEYDTGEIGRIDLLAHHKTEPRWLVVELKRNQTGDQTIGQVLRYMGWANKNLAASGDRVEGMIISRSSDASLQYALLNTSNVKLLLYDVTFHLRAAP